MDQPPLARFGPFAFDRTRMVLHRDGCPVPIGGRGAAILAALSEAGGQVVTRAELLDAVWQGQVVEERNLTVQIALLRQAMGSLPDGSDPIRTVSRVGYRLMLDAPRATILELRPSVAVLPFANLSGEPGLAFFADGVTEDIIAALSRFRTFAVVARGSSCGCRAHAATAVEAAAALGVRYVLEGSVRREGHRLRVGARLTDAAGTVLWADRFEEELGGVFEIQDRITAVVVRLVQPRISRAEIERSRRKQPENLDAYDHFMQGMAFYDLPDATSAVRYDGMVHHLDRAAELDPSFPQALACAGFAHELRRSYGGTAPAGTDDYATALDLIDRAHAQAEDDALVLAIAAISRHSLRDDVGGAIAQAEQALTLNPHCYPVVDLAATIHMQSDQPDRAIELFQHCLRLSPNSPSDAMSMDGIAVSHVVAGRFREAVEWGRRVQAIQAGWNSDSLTLVVAYAMLGQLGEARSELERFLALKPGFTIRELQDSRPPRTLNEGDRIWTEGLRRAGLAEG